MSLHIVRTPHGVFVGTLVENTTETAVLRNVCPASHTEGVVHQIRLATSAGGTNRPAYYEQVQFSAPSPEMVFHAPFMMVRVREDVASGIAARMSTR